MRMRCRWGAVTALGLVVSALPACPGPDPRKADPFRDPSRPNRSDVLGTQFDVVIVHRQPGDEEIGLRVWQGTDEGAFSAPGREAWLRNGLRAGLAGSPPPPLLARLFEQKSSGRYRAHHWAVPFGESRRLRLTEQRQTRTFLLVGPEGAVSGQEFDQAVADLLLTAEAAPEGAISLKVTPVIEYGRIRPHIEPDAVQGVFESRLGRDQQTLAFLSLGITVRSGQMVVLGAAPQRLTGSVGDHCFFESGKYGPEQKLLLMRLTRVSPERPVGPPVRSAP